MRTSRIALSVLALLGLLDVVALAGLGSEDAPPWPVLLVGVFLGLATLAAVPGAWRGHTTGTWTVIISRVLSALLGVGAFLDPGAPGWARGVVVITSVLTVAGIVMLRRPARVEAQPV